MSGSPGARAGGGASPELVRRAIELNYEARQRALSIRWGIINAIILLVFAYDLTRWCAAGGAALYVEAGVAGAALAAGARHALRLLRPRAHHPAPLPITPRQRRLLALNDMPLDGSFELVEEDDSPVKAGRGRAASDGDGADAGGVLCGAGRGPPRPADAAPPPASPPRSPPSPTAQDRFIADSASLTEYLRQYAERSAAEWSGAGGAGVGVGVCGARAGGGGARYAVAAPPSPDPAAPPLQPQPFLWARLDIDPERLTQFNLNLRLWIHVTILERLVREMGAVDAALARAGLPALGEAGPERLRALAAPAAHPAHPLHSLTQLLPFLEPFQDQRYVVRRIRELSRGGCLSEYRWCGGGAGWDEAGGAGRPTDAELVVSLVAAYLDAALPGPPPRPFSALHVSAAPPAPQAPPPHPLMIVRVSARPPHYALALDGELLEVGGGRNNLLHVLLVFLAAAARRAPPGSPLRRHNLGPAGLNMLWIIGR